MLKNSRHNTGGNNINGRKKEIIAGMPQEFQYLRWLIVRLPLENLEQLKVAIEKYKAGIDRDNEVY